MGATLFSAVSGGAGLADVSSFSVECAIDARANIVVLVLGLGNGQVGALGSVTWGGVAPTRSPVSLESINYRTYIRVWEGAVGGTKTLAGTISGIAKDYTFTLYGLAGIYQSAAGQAGTGSSCSLPIEVGTGCIALEGDVTNDQPTTPASGQTEDNEDEMSNSWGAQYHVAGPLSALGLTFAGSCNYTHGACVIGGGGGNQIIWVAFRRWQKFLADLRAGLVPRDLLQRRHGEMVTI